MTLRAIFEVCQEIDLFLQHGHYENLLNALSRHYWQYILEQQLLSTASLANSKQRGQTKFSFSSMGLKQFKNSR